MKKSLIIILIIIIIVGLFFTIGIISYNKNYVQTTNVSGTNECCTCEKSPQLDVCCTCKISNPFKMTIKGYEYLLEK